MSATRDDSGKAVTLGIVNRHREDAITTTIEVGGSAPILSATAHEVNGDDPKVLNSFDRPDAVVVQDRQLTASGTTVEITLPAHSVTVVRLAL